MHNKLRSTGVDGNRLCVVGDRPLPIVGWHEVPTECTIFSPHQAPNRTTKGAPVETPISTGAVMSAEVLSPSTAADCLTC